MNKIILQCLRYLGKEIVFAQTSNTEDQFPDKKKQFPHNG